MMYSIKEILKSLLKISSSNRSIFLNNKEYCGGKNLVKIQQSIIIDYIESQLKEFNIEHFKYYEFVLQELIENPKDIETYGENLN